MISQESYGLKSNDSAYKTIKKYTFQDDKAKEDYQKKVKEENK